MFLKRVCLISAILAVTWAAPRKLPRPRIPTWHLPCGEQFDSDVTSSEESVEDMKVSLQRLRLQHQLTMNDYLNRDYEYLYEQVNIHLDDRRYIPNWVPSKKDVNLVRKLVDANPETIINHFPKLHVDLQKFAVAFEELINDEHNPQIETALRATQAYLTMMLCQVESNIIAIPSLQLPTRVERSIMSTLERDVDETKRLVRDWGVILKYRDYLHGWRHVFKY